VVYDAAAPTIKPPAIEPHGGHNGTAIFAPSYPPVASATPTIAHSYHVNSRLILDKYFLDITSE